MKHFLVVIDDVPHITIANSAKEATDKAIAGGAKIGTWFNSYEKIEIEELPRHFYKLSSENPSPCGRG